MLLTRFVWLYVLLISVSISEIKITAIISQFCMVNEIEQIGFLKVIKHCIKVSEYMY